MVLTFLDRAAFQHNYGSSFERRYKEDGTSWVLSVIDSNLETLLLTYQPYHYKVIITQMTPNSRTNHILPKSENFKSCMAKSIKGQ